MHTATLRDGIAAGTAAMVLGTTIALVGGSPATPVRAQAARSHHHDAPSSTTFRSRKAIALRNGMRKLWEDHIIWTRQFIVSYIAGLEDTNTAATQLLSNQDDIGDAIKPFYGEDAGEQLSSLLRDHILIAADLLKAAKDGDSAGVQDARARWDANADEIAQFLYSANPSNWPLEDMRSMMTEHLNWTLTEATSRLQGDWDSDVEAFDHVHQDILHMADMLSRGIIAQFPNKF